MGFMSYVRFRCSRKSHRNSRVRKNWLAVARRAKGFDMDIIYHNRHGRNIQNEEQVGAKYVSLEELVQKSDFLSLHCPLNNENYHVINRSIFKLMKKGAYLINTARGSL